MSTTKTPEEFKQQVYQLVGDEYTLLEDYKTKRIKVKIKHNPCGFEWNVRPSDFLRGTRCPDCYRKKRAEAQRLGNEEFQKRVYKKFADEFEVGEYINNRTKVHMQHKKCNYEWDILPSNIYKLKGCPKCLGNRYNITTDDFKKQVFDAVGDEYSVLGEYEKATSKLLLRHNICKYEYPVTPANFLSGSRCPKCAPNVAINKLKARGYDFGAKTRGKSKYNVREGDTYGYWLVLKTMVHSLEGAEKNRNTYNNALCLCTKCKKNKKVISYSRLVLTKDSNMCKECAGCLTKTTQQYIHHLKEKNPLARLKEGEIYINNNTKLIHLCSSCSMEIKITPDAALRGQHLCKECAYLKGASERTRTTNEYIQELAMINKLVKLKEGEEYITSNTKIKHICSRCGNDWSVKPSKVLQGHVMCNNCSRQLFESIHATIIKQVYKHHYPEAVWEERIYVDDGNKYYDIDIVNHKRKEAIEIDGIQHTKISGWHRLQAKRKGVTPQDILKQQQLRDNKVNQYFESIGYNLIRIQIHNLSPLEALQQIFPQYKHIPEWIDFSGKITRDTWDIAKAQELLNQHMSMAEVARQVGVFQSVITLAIKNGKLQKPKGFRSSHERSWSLDEAQKLLNEYKTYNEIREMLSISEGSFRHALYVKKLTLPPDYKEKIKKE